MAFFVKLDLYILDRIFQPLADWIEYKTGKSCFWLAKITAWIVITMTTAPLIDYAIHREIQPWHMIILAFSLIYITEISEYEKLDKKRAAKTLTLTMNPKRMFYWYGFSRLIVISIGLFAILTGCAFGYIATESMMLTARFALLMTVVCGIIIAEPYFAACTPKPPRPKPLVAQEALQAHPMRV